jgi:hypothetical protein
MEIVQHVYTTGMRGGLGPNCRHGFSECNPRSLLGRCTHRGRLYEIGAGGDSDGLPSLGDFMDPLSILRIILIAR